KIFPLNPQCVAERYAPVALAVGRLGVVFTAQQLRLPFGIIGNDELDGIKHSHPTPGGFIEIFTDTEFQQSYINDVFSLGHSDTLTEITDTGRGISPPA